MKFWEFVEYENEGELLVYKHPCQDFNTNTKLVVREGQIAVFLHNGEIGDVFQPGRYRLSTENLPILGKLTRIFTGGENTFTAEVFFISTTNVMALKWGTSSPMDLVDPYYDIICRVAGSGEASFKVIDPLAFFKQIVGTTSSFEKTDLIKFFRSTINMHIKNAVSSAITKDNISLLELNSHLMEISKSCKAEINEKIAEFGSQITLFSIENLGVVDGDPSLEKLKAAFAKRAEMKAVGYTYQQERSFDVMDKVAERGGSAGSGIGSTIVEAGVGLGVAGAVAGSMKDMAAPLKDAASPSSSPSQSPVAQPSSNGGLTCPKCGTSLPAGAKFCSECGEKIPTGPKFCPECGTKLAPGAKFCCECGKKL